MCGDRVRRGIFILSYICALFVVGCASTSKELVLDSPQHRLTNGQRLLDFGRLEDAREEFLAALKLDPSCCAALRGISISWGMQERFDKAFEVMRKAESCSKDDLDRSLAAVGFIRLNTFRKGKGWIETTERFFLKAIEYDPSNCQAYYYLGVAYAQAKMFPKALWAYRKAVEIGGPFGEKAKQKAEQVQKVIDARPESEFGQSIALRGALTRGDIAVLLVRELHLDEIFRQRGVDLRVNSPKKISVPQDIVGHPYQKEISTVLMLGVQGLTLLPDGSFGPDLQVSRSEFATILGYILKKLQLLSTSKSQGKINPFLDISKGAPYFADVLACTRRTHLMDDENGLFRPMELISGADALISLSRTKELLRHHLTPCEGTTLGS